MIDYQNLSGDSGVARYEIGDEFIVVEFVGRDKPYDRIYLYTNTNPGESHVETMKTLAKSGRGLSTHIAQKINRLPRPYHAKCRDETGLDNLRKLAISKT